MADDVELEEVAALRECRAEVERLQLLNGRLVHDRDRWKKMADMEHAGGYAERQRAERAEANAAHLAAAHLERCEKVRELQAECDAWIRKAERRGDWPTFIERYTAWAVETFPSGTSETASKHLLREAGELLSDQSAEEAADCLMLLLFIAHRQGWDLLAEAQRKFETNLTREWAPPDADGIAEHVRTQATPATQSAPTFDSQV